jgi:small subunit ribosomal protein S18
MIQKRQRRIIVPRNCEFCKEKTPLNFKEVATMSKYISERGRLKGRDLTGLCAKHQRKLTTSVKQARHMALLPFVSGL